MTSVRVSVVVVTWNGLALTVRCLDALRAQEVDGIELELVVVDNGSQDGTVGTIADQADVHLVALQDNLGFAGGVNAGVLASTGDIVVLINNDAVAEPTFVSRLVAPFAQASAARLGATTGRVVLSGSFAPADPHDDALVAHDGARWMRVEDGIRLLNSTGNELTTSGNGRDRDWLAPADGDVTASAEVFGFNGGCAALRRTALDDVGPFEESFFMYYEDTDLSWRLRRRGWDVRHVADAGTVHDHAASSGTSSAFFLDHNERNRVLVALVHAPWPVVARASGRTLARTVLGPDRARRVRVVRTILARVPWALRRRRAVDRHARVPRSVPAALLVADGVAR